MIKKLALTIAALRWDISRSHSQCVQGTLYCDRQAEPPVKGELQRHEVDGKELWNLNLDADCTYKLWDPPAITRCLPGKWVVLSGASQTAVWTSQLVNSLVPGSLITKQDNYSIDGVFTQLLDIVIKDGEVVYKNVVMDPRWNGNPDMHRYEAHTQERDDTVLRSGFALVNEAPAFEPGMIRITNFMAEYWDSVGLALEAVEGATNWADAEVTVAVTVGLWYINNWWCNPKQKFNNWCGTRPTIASNDYKDIVARYKIDMELAMPKLKSFCSASGRASISGCSLLSIDHCQNMKEKDKIWRETFEVTQEVMAPYKMPLLRFIDLWTLTLQLPENCLGGHQSQMSAIFTWQVLFSNICPLDDPSPEGTMASLVGSTCRSAATSAACPDNGHKKGFHFEWECGLAVPCHLEAVKAPPGISAAKPCPTTTTTTTMNPLLNSSTSLMAIGFGGVILIACAIAFALIQLKTPTPPPSETANLIGSR